MADVNNQNDLISYFRDSFPGRTREMNDEEVFGYAKGRLLELQNKDIGEYQPVAAIPSIVPNDNSKYADPELTSPEGIQSLWDMSSNIMLGGAAEFFTDKGIDVLPGTDYDISPEFFRKAYNNSLAGNLYQAINGKPKYSIEDYPEGWAAEAGSFLVGMMSPLEIGGLMATGGVANIAGRGTTSVLGKYGLNALLKNASTGKSVLVKSMIESGVSQGIALGAIGASHASAASAASQRMAQTVPDETSPTGERGVADIDPMQVALDGAHGFGESFMIGLPAGLVTKGFLGGLHANAVLQSRKLKQPLSLSKKALTGMPAQLVTETLAFTALPNLYKEVGLESYKDYPMIGSDEWKTALATNAAIITPMFMAGRGYEKWKGIDEAQKWVGKKLEHVLEVKKSGVERAENVKDNFYDVEISKSLIEDLETIGVSFNENTAQIADFGTKSKKLVKLLDKYTEEQIRDGKVSKTDGEWMVGDGNETFLNILGGLDDLAKNPNDFRRVLEDLSVEEYNKRKAKGELKEGEEPPTAISDAVFAKEQSKLNIHIQKLRDMYATADNAINGQTKAPDAPPPPSPPKAKMVTLVKEFQKYPGSTPIIDERKVIEGSDLYKKLTAETPEGGYRPLVTEGDVAATGTTKLTSIMRTTAEGTAGQEVMSILKKTVGRGTGKDKKQVPLYEGISRLDNDSKVALSIALSGRTSKQAEIKTLDNILVHSGIKDIGALGQEHVQAWLDSMVAKKGKGWFPRASLTSGLNKISNFLHAKGIIERNFSDRTFWTEAVKQQNIEAKLAGQIPGADVSLIAKVVDRVANKQSPVKLPDSDLLAYQLMERYQIRDVEIDGLKVQHWDKNTNSFDLTRTGGGKAATGAKAKDRILYITDKNVIKKINNAIENKNPNDLIFKSDQANVITKALQSEFKEYKGVNWKKGSSKILRKLGQGTAEYTDLNKTEMQIWQAITGHDLGVGMTGRISEIYGNLTNAKNAELGAKMGEIVLDRIFNNGKERVTPDMYAEMKPKRAPKYQREPIGAPTKRSELTPFLRKRLKENPGLDIRTLEDANYAGRFLDGVIDITLGKANKATFYHENAHRLKKMIDSTGNKELRDIWAQGEKLFKNDKPKGKPMEEYMSDILSEWSIGQLANKTLSSKVSSWANRLWSKVKKVFLGKQNLNKNDIKNLLGEKVYKGFAFSEKPGASNIAKYQFASTKDMAKAVKEDFNFAVKQTKKKLNATEKNVLIEYIARRAGVENPEAFKLGSSTMAEADISAFSNTLNTLPFDRIVKIKDKVTFFKTLSSVERLEKDFINIDNRKKMLKFLGTENGDIYKASNNQITEYQAYLKRLKTPEAEKDALDHVDYQMIETIPNMPKNLKRLDGLMGEIAAVGLPVHTVIKLLGFKDLSQRLLTHSAVESRHTGIFTEGFEGTARQILGRIGDKGFAWDGTIGRKGVKDNLYLTDVPRYLERLNAGRLTTHEKKFVNKVFKSDFLIVKDGQYVQNTSKYKNVKDGFNLNSKEGKIAEAWQKYTEYIPRMFKEVTKGLFKTEAEHKAFLASENVKWITGNIYVTRSVTKQFQKFVGRNNSGRYWEALTQESTIKLAQEMAVEKYKTKNPTNEQIKGEMMAANDVVAANVNDMMNFGSARFKSKYLQKRHIKLPEYIKIDGKEIKVYATSYENTIKSYALGMSKYLTTLEFFPDMTKLKGDAGGALTGRPLDALFGKYKTVNPEWGHWMENQVKRTLGVHDRALDMGNSLTRTMDKMATVYSKTALGFITAGLKNLILGQSMNLQAYKIRDYFRGLIDIQSADFRRDVRLSGATELGLRHIMSLKTAKIWNAFFRLGGMQPTENFNRYISVATSKYEQTRLIDTIYNSKGSSRQIKKAKNRLEKYYFLDKNQIKLLEKYGNNGLDGYNLSGFEKSKLNRSLENIHQKLNHYAHINTQGASMSLFMPAWADKKFAKPLTLFKRMAYAASSNQVRNFTQAVKQGDSLKIAFMALAPTAGGLALGHIYHFLLGTPLPDENSDWFTAGKTYFVKGEGLGLATDAIRLIDGESAEFTISPALYSWGWAGYDWISAPIRGTKTVKQSTEDFVKSTSSLYRAWRANFQAKDNDFNRGMAKYRTMYYEFKEEVMPDELDYVGDKLLTTRSPYYREYKEAFYRGTVDDAAKSAIIMIFQVATDFYKQNPSRYTTYDKALKQAFKQFDTHTTKLNPNIASLAKGDPVHSAKFYKWLNKDKVKGKKYIKEMSKLESQYFYKVAKMKELMLKYAQDPEIRKAIKKSLKKARRK